MVWQEGDREKGERAMACGRIAEVVLLIYDFSTFSNCVGCRGYARQGGGGKMGSEGGLQRGIEVEGWSCSFDLWLGWLMPKDITPWKKKLPPWLKLCFVTCLTGRSDLASFCFVMKVWKGVISCSQVRKHLFDHFIMSLNHKMTGLTDKNDVLLKTGIYKRDQ